MRRLKADFQCCVQLDTENTFAAKCDNERSKKTALLDCLLMHLSGREQTIAITWQDLPAEGDHPERPSKGRWIARTTL